MMTSFTTMTNAQSIEGDWYGKANVMGTDLRINLHIKPSGDVYTCTWDSPDQGGFGLPATTTTFTYPDFAFTYDEAGIKYSGKVDSLDILKLRVYYTSQACSLTLFSEEKRSRLLRLIGD